MKKRRETSLSVFKSLDHGTTQNGMHVKTSYDSHKKLKLFMRFWSEKHSILLLAENYIISWKADKK